MATEMFLSLEGFETRAAATVEEAEGYLSDMRSGDIFIADYHLDGKLTGLDVLQQLRSQQGRDVPAILLSGDLQSMMRVDQDLHSELPLFSASRWTPRPCSRPLPSLARASGA